MESRSSDHRQLHDALLREGSEFPASNHSLAGVFARRLLLIVCRRGLPIILQSPRMDRRIAFGKRLKATRNSLGYSQERLAELAGLHRTYVGGVERGERNISLINIWQVADALGIDPSALFAPSGEPSALDLPRSRSSALGANRKSKKGGTWTKRRKR